jgi:hypothetical protein
MEKFLKDIGITSKGHYGEDKSYIIDIDDSDEFGKYYSRLGKSDLLDEDENSSLIAEENASIVFEGDDYIITLLADFDKDLYKLVCKEIKGDN